MSADTFELIISSLKDFDPLPTIFFGGIGDPLSHPELIEMVRQVKSLGARVELITNGTLLDEELSTQLIEVGLDMLWVSIDGATPESYADVRLGDVLPQVIENLRRHAAQHHRPAGCPAIGDTTGSHSLLDQQSPALYARIGQRDIV
jgi:MoaA/NifB/PqqE/SkfB family radical SAM enzyme